MTNIRSISKFCICFSIFLLLAGCFETRPIVDILDEAIGTLESQSVSWQNVLGDTRDELIKNGHTLVSEDVSNVLSRAISDVGIEARCYTDFLRDRVREDLIRLRAKYTGEKLSLVPVFCNPTPSSVDYEMVKANQLKSVEIAGYNLDASNIKVYLADANNQRVDVTYALGNPAQYLITLNLGSNGVNLNSKSSKIIFVLSSTLERSVNINLPQPSIDYFTPTPILRLCPDKVGGDKDFGGHGPDVNASAELYVKNGNSLWIKLTLSAKETRSDWTEAKGDWSFPLWDAPPDHEIVDFFPDSPSTTSYTDDNHQLDIPSISGSALVSRYEIVGDTDGNDIGNCTKDDVYMNLYFNKVQVKYRIK